jgi:hypothetical protein
MLAECYNWFTEGFETPDLQEAKALPRRRFLTQCDFGAPRSWFSVPFLGSFG